MPRLNTFSASVRVEFLDSVHCQATARIRKLERITGREHRVLRGRIAGGLLAHPEHHRRRAVRTGPQLRLRLPARRGRYRDEGLEGRSLVERARHVDPSGLADQRVGLGRVAGVEDVGSCVSPASGVPVSGFTMVPGVGTIRGSTTVNAGESMRDRFRAGIQLPASPFFVDRAKKRL